MVLEIAQIEVKAGHESAFETGVGQAAELFRRAKGCRGMELQRSVEIPTRYRLMVRWEPWRTTPSIFANRRISRPGGPGLGAFRRPAAGRAHGVGSPGLLTPTLFLDHGAVLSFPSGVATGGLHERRPHAGPAAREGLADDSLGREPPPGRDRYRKNPPPARRRAGGPADEQVPRGLARCRPVVRSRSVTWAPDRLLAWSRLLDLTATDSLERPLRHRQPAAARWRSPDRDGRATASRRPSRPRRARRDGARRGHLGGRQGARPAALRDRRQGPVHQGAGAGAADRPGRHRRPLDEDVETWLPDGLVIAASWSGTTPRRLHVAAGAEPRILATPPAPGTGSDPRPCGRGARC